MSGQDQQQPSVNDEPFFGAFNALLGYMGGQAATDTIFERFLWPQRHFSSFSLRHVPRLTLLYSMGGPISASALGVIDKAYKNGLFHGPAQGHMLGTHFYTDIAWTYTLHALGKEPERQSQVRNCLWVQAMLSLPLPPLVQIRTPRDQEGAPSAVGKEGPKPLRARTAVCHLTLSKATSEETRSSQFSFVSEETHQPSIKTMAEIVATEATGIGVMICVAVITSSLWSIIFIIPLVLRLIGGFFALHREGIEDIPESVATEQERDWEIQCPATEGRFLLISGPPTIVNQFFRHYGHPIRCRYREIIHLTLVVTAAAYFPVGLLCQVTWMPITIQYIWTIWQVWLVLAMHADRYTQKGIWRTTTEAAIAAALFARKTYHESEDVFRSEILFGTQRKGPNVVKASLKMSIADSYGDGKRVLKSFIRS